MVVIVVRNCTPFLHSLLTKGKPLTITSEQEVPAQKLHSKLQFEGVNSTATDLAIEHIQLVHTYPLMQARPPSHTMFYAQIDGQIHR